MALKCENITLNELKDIQIICSDNGMISAFLKITLENTQVKYKSLSFYNRLTSKYNCFRSEKIGVTACL